VGANPQPRQCWMHSIDRVQGRNGKPSARWVAPWDSTGRERPFRISGLFSIFVMTCARQSYPLQRGSSSQTLQQEISRSCFRFPRPGSPLFAADIYWNMVQEIHRLTGVDAGVFHRHYNLKLWFDEGNRRSLHNLAARYRDTFPTNG
jgi:hypothetical protein